MGGCSATLKPSARFCSVSSTRSEPQRSHRKRDLEQRVEEVERAPRHPHREGDGGDEAAALDRAHQEEQHREHAQPVAEPLEAECEERAGRHDHQGSARLAPVHVAEAGGAAADRYDGDAEAQGDEGEGRGKRPGPWLAPAAEGQTAAFPQHPEPEEPEGSAAGAINRQHHDSRIRSPRLRLRLANQYVARPPERSYTAPVLKEHSSEASQATSAATSSGRPTRPMGIFETRRSTVLRSICWSNSVPITAGATALTRMPRVATSFATALVRPITPALAVEYGTRVGLPSLPAIAAMLMMRPLPCGSITFTAARQP